MRVLSLFTGIGAFEKALDKCNIDYELVNFCEVDKFAVQSYCVIHGFDVSLNLGDITKVDEKGLHNFDLLVGGSPCQNISKCGNNKGLKGEQSQLFYDYSRILNYNKPKYFIFENVDNLLRTNKGEDWGIVKEELSKNYNIFYDTLNSKFYDIPQDRNRLFVVGIRKDLEINFDFNKSEKITNKDIQGILETNEEESLYITKLNGRYDEILSNFEKLKDETQRIVKIGNLYEKNGQNGNIYSTKGLSPTLRSGQGVKGSGIGSNNAPKILTTDKKVRKLSSLECWRLMGFEDIDYYKAKKSGVSNTQLYKQAGNSIVVDVLEHIIRNLFL